MIPRFPQNPWLFGFVFFYHFEPVSLSKLAEMITHLKLSVCLPRHYSHSFIQEDTVRPRVLSIIDVFLPAIFKHVVVQPALSHKKTKTEKLNEF